MSVLAIHSTERDCDLRFRIYQMAEIIGAGIATWPYVVFHVMYDERNTHACDDIRARVIGAIP